MRQWLGWQEPDPNNVHYPVMLAAIEKLQERFELRAEDIYIWIARARAAQTRRDAHQWSRPTANPRRSPHTMAGHLWVR